MSKRTIYTFVLFYLSLNILLRYPTFLSSPEAIKGTDAFDSYTNVNSIVDNGFETRFTDIFSFFGLKQYSDNLGSLFLLGTFSELAGIRVEFSILLLSIFVGFYTFLGAFCFSNKLLNNWRYALLFGFVFSTTRIFLSLSRWTFSPRVFFITFIPIFLYLLIKFYLSRNVMKQIDFRFLFLSFLIFIMMLSMHKLTLLLVLSIPMVIISYSYFFISTRLNSYLPDIFYKFKRFPLFVLLLYLYVINLSSEILYVRGRIENFSDLALVFDFSKTIILQYPISFGLLGTLSFFGGLFLIFHEKSTKLNIFYITFLFLFSFIYTDVTYSTNFSLIMLTILVFIFIKNIDLHFSNTVKKRYLAVTVLFIVAQLSPEFFVFREKGYEYMPPSDVQYDRNVEIKKAVEAGHYKNHYHYNETMFCYLISCDKIKSNANFRPVWDENYPYIVNYTYFSLSDLKVFLSGETDYISVSKGIDSPSLYYGVLLSGEEADSVQVKYEIRRVFGEVDSYLVGLYSSNNTYISKDNGEWVQSTFLVSTLSGNYKYYDNGYHQFYQIRYQ